MEPLDATDLRRRALEVIREVVDFDAYVWILTDPVTAVGAAPLADVPCLPELPALIRAKYATSVNRWTVLLEQESPVALLGGHAEGSLVWREVQSRYGVRDVASMVFADPTAVGVSSISGAQRRRSPPLTRASSRPHGRLTKALRECQSRTFVEAATPRRADVGPVVLTLQDDLTIESRTAASKDWLDALLPPRPDRLAVPASVYNVAAQLLAVEAGVDTHPAQARTHLADGFWLTLRAARLGAEDFPPTGRAPDRRDHRGDLRGRPARPVRTHVRALRREFELLRRLATGATPGPSPSGCAFPSTPFRTT